MQAPDPPDHSEPTVRTVVGGGEPPEDPVGVAVAEFLADLLDGIVVELVYSQHLATPVEPEDGLAEATSHRRGPGPWTTTMIVHVVGGAAALSLPDQHDGRAPAALADFTDAAFRAADTVGRRTGLDGNVITPPMKTALQESVVTEIICRQIERLAADERDAASSRDVVAAILAELERVTVTTVEGHPVSLGVVMHPDATVTPTSHRFPDDYRQQRTPMLFDGRAAVLVIDRDGHALHEVQRDRMERTLEPHQLANARLSIERYGGLDGSAVVAVSHALGGIGFLARHDRSIWICVNGTPLLVKRSGSWRALPNRVLLSGIERFVGVASTAQLVLEGALLLSLRGHGGILAIAESGHQLDAAGIVPPKDRVDRIDPDAVEAPIHQVLDTQDLDASTLLRLAILDGACILDSSGVLLAYGAVVNSTDSQGEGARTAAARHLSEHLAIVIKISEDGPITVFHRGSAIAQLLGGTC